MLFKLENRAYSNEQISVGTNRYPVDPDGFVIATPTDARALIDIAGFRKVGEVDEINFFRLPETQNELFLCVKRMGLSSNDLRAMADLLDAKEALEDLSEPEPVEKQEETEDLDLGWAIKANPERVGVKHGKTPEQENKPETKKETKTPIVDADPDDLSVKGKQELIQLAVSSGLRIDGRWGKRKILEVLQQESTP